MKKLHILVFSAFALSIIKIAAQSLPKTPEEVGTYFKTNFNNGNLDNLMLLYEPESVFVTKPGTSIPTSQIKDALAQFLSLKLPMENNLRHVYEQNGIAMVITDWKIEGIGPDGNSFKMEGSACDILKKQKDGTWKYLIDNPFGTLNITGDSK